MKLRFTTYFLLLFLFIFSHNLFSQNTIKLTVKNIQKDSAMIAYHLGNKQFIMGDDNGGNHYIKFNKNGEGEFTSDKIKKGMYLIVFPPNNQYVEFLYDGNDLNISLDRNNLHESIRFKNSLTNTLFYQHIRFINNLTDEKNKVLKNLKKGKDDKEIAEKSAILDKKYKEFSKDFLNRYSDNMAAKFLKASGNLEIPEKYKTKDERFNYYKANYFKDINFNDEWLIRTPFFLNRVEVYVEKLTSVTPKDIIASVDYIIGLSENNSELYQFLVVHFLNKYAKSKLMIGENIYAHIAKKYYVSGKANWVEKTQLDKIIENYNKVKNGLIGSRVNDFQLISSSGKKTFLNNNTSEYKILYFSKSDCKECSINQYFNTKPQNTKVYNILIDLDQNQLKDFANTNAQTFVPSIISEKDKSLVFKQLDVSSYLKVYVLDRNNTIIGKRISMQQAYEIINKRK